MNSINEKEHEKTVQYIDYKTCLMQFIKDGAVNYSDGKNNNSPSVDTSYSRTDYLFTTKGTMLSVYGLKAVTSSAAIAVYDIFKTYSQAHSIQAVGANSHLLAVFTMPFDGYIRLTTAKSSITNNEVIIKDITGKKRINLLALGNSFTQDVFAYLPVILNELLPDYVICYGVGYRSSASLSDYVEILDENKVLTWFNYWRVPAIKWTRYAGGGTTEKKINDVLALQDWNLIYVQGTGSIKSTGSMDTNVVTPTRQLFTKLHTAVKTSVPFITGQWLAPQANVFDMKTCMEYIKSKVGFSAILPIGTGIANARSNSTLAALGNSGDMLYDGIHQQSGLPALISSYVLALSLAEFLGERVSIYNSSFVPTNENCIAINAYQEKGMVSPLPMTHGDSVGVTTENISAAKKIAELAVNNPFIISECSSILDV